MSDPTEPTTEPVEPVTVLESDAPPAPPGRVVRKIPVISPDGEAGTIDDTEVEFALKHGYQIELPEETQRRFDAEEYDDPATAAIYGGLRGASLGILGMLPNAERQRKLAEANPAATLGGELVGAVGSMLVPGAPAALIGKAGASAARGTEAALAGVEMGRVARAGASLVPGLARGATEGALFGAGQGIEELGLSEDPLTAERIISTIGSDALFGAATGGGLSVGGALLGRAARGARNMAQRYVTRTEEAAAKATTATEGAGVEAFPDVAEMMGKRDLKGLRAAARAERERLSVEQSASRFTFKEAEKAELGRLADVNKTDRAAVAKEIASFTDDVKKAWVPSENAETQKLWAESRRVLRHKADVIETIAEKPWHVKEALQRQAVGLRRVVTEGEDLPAQIAARDARIVKEMELALAPAAQAAVSEGAPVGWTDFLKGKMGPAMKEAGGDHSIAIRKLSEEFKAYKASVAPQLAPSRDWVAFMTQHEEFPAIQAAKNPEIRQSIVDRLRKEFEAIRTTDTLVERAGENVRFRGNTARAYEQFAGLRATRKKTITISLSEAGRFKTALQNGETVSKRLAALENAKSLLPRNLELQARIDAVSGPPSSPKLGEIRTSLEELVGKRLASPRLDALETAADAVANIPKPGLGQRLLQAGVGGATFTAATALGVPPTLAGVLGGSTALWAGDAALGTLRGKLAGGASTAAKAVSKSLDLFVTATDRATRAAPVIASKVLGSVSFAPPEIARTVADRTPPTKDKGLAGFWARSREIQAQTTPGPNGKEQLRPDAAKALHERMSGIWALSPALGDQMEGIAARRLTFLADKLPKRPDWAVAPVGPDRWRPSDAAVASFARTVEAVERPGDVLRRLADGTLTPEDAEAIRVVYPETFADIQMGLLSRLATLRQALPYKRRLTYSILFGVPVDPAMRPEIVALLQSNFETEPGTEGGIQQPKPSPQFGSVTKTPATRAQEAAG